MLAASSLCFAANGEDVDPKLIAALVSRHIITFAAESGVTIGLPNGEIFSIEVAVSHRGDGEYESVTDLAHRLNEHPSPGPPAHPPPPDNGRHPSIPIAPAPRRSGGVSNAPQRMQELAQRQVIVGRLRTTHLTFGEKVLRGDFTMVIMEYRGTPVVVLVDNAGEFVVSSQDIVFMTCTEAR